jgi:hypothetical protein
LKQASAGSAGISGSLLKDGALHTATRLGIEDFKASNGRMDCFQQNVYTIISGECKREGDSTVVKQREQLLHIIKGNEAKNI